MQSRKCPVCGSGDGERLDRKVTYSLLRCSACQIIFRYPYENADEMAGFYQSDYVEAGLTTELPDLAELDKLVSSNFSGTAKDFSRVIESLALLGVDPPASVFDYGANWGYGVHQLSTAGYHSMGYEISRPRAAFAEKLGISLSTSMHDVSGQYSAVYSGHVLEHVPNPRETLEEQLELVRDGGFVLFHTPNGSDDRRKQDFAGFHGHWGRVHPVLISDRFIQVNFPQYPSFVTSSDNLSPLGEWNQETSIAIRNAGGELFGVIKKASV